MKRYAALLFFASLFSTYYSYSQIAGKCIDNHGKELPYVNISIKGKPIGTVSNAEGNFYIANSSITDKDSLIFSHLNFEKKTLRIPLKRNEIQLDSKVVNLKEVVISNKKRKFKEKIVGTKTTSDNVVTYFTSRNLGTEIGKIITVKKHKIYNLQNVQFNIPDFAYKSATFRINFYKITDGTIHLLKVNENKIDNVIKITKSGIVNFDLSDQHLSFDDNFLVAVEWIDFENNGNIENEFNIIKFSSTVFSGPYISRDNVNLEWENNKVFMNIGIGIHLKVNEYSS
jgi:hypothetical protein